MVIKRRFSVLLAIVLMTSFSNKLVYGIDADNIAIMQQLQQEEPELFERVELVTENNRDLLKVTLSDVLLMVLKRSNTIEAQRLGEKAARSGVEASRAIYQTSLETSATQSKTAGLSSTDLDDNDPPSATSYLATTSTDATALSATVSKKTSLGISFSSTLSSSKSQTDRFSMEEKGDDLTKTGTGEEVDSSSLSATVSIPLFQDWGEINDLPIKRSRILLDQAKTTTYSTGVGLLESVANEYWNLVGVQENIKTLKEAVNLSEKLVRETRARVQVGVLNPTDLKETQTQLANNRKDLLTKQIEEQETEDKIRVALDLGTIPFGFKPADLPRIHGEDFDFQELLKKAYENSTDLKTLMLSLTSNQYDLDDAYNDDKTNLDLSLTYTLNGYGDSPSETTQYYANDEYQGYSAKLTWSVPLFDDSASEAIMQRKIERNKLELQVKDAKAEIYVTLQTILRNLKFGIEEEKAAQLSVNLAKDLLDKEVEKLKIGKSTSFNVSQAQKNYTEAKLGETLVKVGNERNFVKLLVLTGDIFSYYKLPKSI